VRRLRIAFGVSLGLVLLALAGLVVNGYRRGSALPEAAVEPDTAGPKASLTLNGVRVTETSGDATRWELSAARGEYFESRQLTVLSDVEVTFFTRDGRTLTLRGDSGTLHTDTKNISVAGNVVATSSEGYRVTTGALDYTNRDRTVRGDGPVALVGEAVEVAGTGVAIQVEDQRISIPDGVASVLRPEQAAPAHPSGGS
jgi:lipopolysaccharide export system protein LptC